jgi:Flp pilus assembly protein TadG
MHGMNRRGSVALATAAVAVLVIGAAGFAIDNTRVWLVRARLKTALDAAALVAARQIDDPGRDTQATAVFWANYNQNQGRDTYMGATVTRPIFTMDPANNNQVRVTASASVPTTIFGIISPSRTSFTDSSTAERAATGLEVAVVLDQTSSMRDPAPGYSSKLAAAQAAVGTMLNVLYGGRDTQPYLWVSVVPFARTINFGNTAQTRGWMNVSSPPMPTGWNWNTWSGCVESRRDGMDITEDPPSGAGMLRPYFWRDTYRQYGTAGATSGPTCSTSTSTSSRQAYNADPTDGKRWCMGDNDWGAPTSLLPQNQLWDYYRDQNFTSSPFSPSGRGPFGPNNLCALSPILPLTASRTTVMAAVNAITAPVKSGGTAVVPGLQGGWFTLSPQWQDAWGLPDLPAQGSSPAERRPLRYGMRNMQKVIVLLTDGDNNWQSARDYGVSTVRPTQNGNELFYSSYGRLADRNGRYPGFEFTASTNHSTTRSRAEDALDDRLELLCTQLKRSIASGGPGIILYVVGFEVASAHEDRLRNCATTPNHYFESPSASDLQRVFREIGNQLASLRLAR